MSSSDKSGDAGAPKPPPDPDTDPDVKDYGPPAESDEESDPDAGTSGADEGISPWSPEAYDEEPEGPTTSTED
jgi:hypothetical protein